MCPIKQLFLLLYLHKAFYSQRTRIERITITYQGEENIWFIRSLYANPNLSPSKWKKKFWEHQLLLHGLSSHSVTYLSWDAFGVNPSYWCDIPDVQFVLGFFCLFILVLSSHFDWFLTYIIYSFLLTPPPTHTHQYLCCNFSYGFTHLSKSKSW